ncbi:hypothetical protein G9A89_021163 [Geosiphon pyriformis]|nr:hypothetical protein G9A89_021163 [Geosiphon pyriformis]
MDVSTFKKSSLPEQASTTPVGIITNIKPPQTITTPKSGHLLSSSSSRKRPFVNAVTKKAYSNIIKNNGPQLHRLSLRTPETAPTPPTTPPSLLALARTTTKVECQVRARIPTSTGEFFLYLYKNNGDNKEHLAVVYGDDIRSRTLDTPRVNETEMDRILRGAYAGRLKPGRIRSDTLEYSSSSLISDQRLVPPPPLVRIHSECFTGETVHSARCDCGEQLQKAMQLIQKEGRGVIVYLRQEGRGIGLAEKLRAYNLQDLGHDTVTANLLLQHPPDLRTYEIATQILVDLSLTEIRLLTNNPDKIEQIENDGIKVIERLPMIPQAWQQDYDPDRTESEVDQYLKVKIARMRHLLDVPEILLP